MKLEDQVVSLPLAKRLKELGVKQDSIFFWRKETFITEMAGKDAITGQIEARPTKIEWKLAMTHEGYFDWHAAFTVAELGEMLPVEIKHKAHIHAFKMEYSKFEVGWEIHYRCYVHRDSGTQSFSGKYSEADIRAKMLIFLIENNLIEVPKNA